MKNWKRALAVLVTGLATSLVGCTPMRYYPLPVSSGEARATFAPIATAASEMGYKFWRWDDSVSVQADPLTRLAWMFDASNDYVLCVQLKTKTPPDGVETAFAAGKRIADAIWRRAMALRPPQPVQVVVPVPEPAPAVQINLGR